MPAFALALGHGEVVAGLLATGPFLTGALLQLVTPAGVQRLASHRRWMVSCALLQGATFLPLLVGALLGRLPVELLFAVAAVYWGTGLSAGSAWNSWMVGLVPPRIRARFFARRTRLTQGALAASLLFGGVLLHAVSTQNRPMVGFAVLFGLAGACRLVSAGYLSRQSEVIPVPGRQGFKALRDIAGSLCKPGPRKLFGYLLSVQLTVHVAAPFFTPYMLQRLELSYGSFVILTGTSFLSRILVLPMLGKVAEQRGARRLLAFGGIGLVPLPVLWVVSDHLGYLVVLQILAGIAWGGYELAVLLLFFEVLESRDRLGLLAVFNLGNAVAMVLGSILGAGLLSTLGPHPLAYALVFSASSVGRLLTLVLLRRVPEIEAQLPPVPTRAVAVRPSMGAIQPPIVAAFPQPTRPSPAVDGVDGRSGGAA